MRLRVRHLEPRWLRKWIVNGHGVGWREETKRIRGVAEGGRGLKGTERTTNGLAEKQKEGDDCKGL